MTRPLSVQRVDHNLHAFGLFPCFSGLSLRDI